MKKALCIALCLILCGCSVRKLESVPTQSFQSDITIRLALFDKVPAELERQADEYHNAHPSIHFEILRHPNDIGWRAWLTEQMRTQPITGFSVGGYEDIQFFSSSAADLPSGLSETSIQNKAFPFSSYACGIWYNDQILSALGIDPSSLQTMQGLTSAVQTLQQRGPELNLTHPVCSQTDLEPLVSSVSFNKGVPDQSLQTLLSLAGKQSPEDPAKCLIDRQCALYFGSSRKIASVFSSNAAPALSVAPIPYAQGASLVNDQDFICICSNASQPEQQALADFLKQLSSSLRSPAFDQAELTPQALNGIPPGWEDAFYESSELVRLNQISWEEFSNRMLQAWKIGTKLEVNAVS